MQAIKVKNHQWPNTFVAKNAVFRSYRSYPSDRQSPPAVTGQYGSINHLPRPPATGPAGWAGGRPWLTENGNWLRRAGRKRRPATFTCH